jgi:hypothetical protein
VKGKVSFDQLNETVRDENGNEVEEEDLTAEDDDDSVSSLFKVFNIPNSKVITLNVSAGG